MAVATFLSFIPCHVVVYSRASWSIVNVATSFETFIESSHRREKNHCRTSIVCLVTQNFSHFWGISEFCPKFQAEAIETG